MNWIIAVLGGWAVVALVLGLVIGNGIRIERGIEPEVPVRAAEGAVPAAGGVHRTAPAEAVRSEPEVDRGDALAHQGSLTGAR
jgi:hypothetical protein